MSEDDYESLPTSSVYVNMFAGALAGITEHVALYPVDSIKVQFLPQSLKRLIWLDENAGGWIHVGIFRSSKRAVENLCV